MTAHPKIDYESGEMLFFGYNADGGITKTFNVVDRTEDWFAGVFRSILRLHGSRFYGD